MRNFSLLHTIFSALFIPSLLLELLSPLCARAQERKPAINQWLRQTNFTYLRPYGLSNTYIDSLLRKAIWLRDHNQTDNAERLLMRTLKLSELGYYPKGVAESQGHLGGIFLVKNKLERSKACFYSAAYFLEQSGIRPEILGRIYNALATVYARQGIRDSALVYYYRSLKVAESLPVKDSLLMAQVYNNIVGGVFTGYSGYSGKKEQVLYYLNQARPLAMGLGVRGAETLGDIYINTGMVHDRMEDDTAAALTSFRLGLDQYQSINQKEKLQFGYCLVAMMYLDRKCYEAVKPYLDSAIAMNKEGFSSSRELNQIMAGYLLYKKEYSRSVFYYTRAMDISDRSGSSNFKLVLYYFRAQAYNKMGLGLKAYEDQKRHSDLLDSLMNKQRIEAVNGMETRYRTAEKDKKLLQGQLELQQKEDRIQKKNIWIGGTVAAALLALLFIISRQRNKQKLLSQQQEIALLSSRMQGEDLERSRIARELHDGVSVMLSAVKMNYSALGKENPALAGTDTFREVSVLLHQTVQEVRSISHNLVPGLLMHQSLPAAVQAFCELIRKGYNLHVELLAYGSFTGTDIEWNYAIYRMVQELIHNVIKHAKATEILIQLTLHPDKLHLTVEDDGIGFEKGKPAMGLGLQSLRQRVEKMNGQLLFSSKSSEGTTVEIEIPVTAS